MKAVRTPLVTEYGEFELACFDDETVGPDEFALLTRPFRNSRPLVRVQSECVTGHVLSSLSCDCRGQLLDALTLLQDHGAGVMIYLRQEGRGIGLLDKVRAYNKQVEGFDTVDANTEIGRLVDERHYIAAARMLQALDMRSIDLLTNNPDKAQALRSFDLEVVEVKQLPPRVNPRNRDYLTTKISRLHHTFNLSS